MADTAAAETSVRTRPPNPFEWDSDDFRSWKELTGDAEGCTRCALSESRTQVVFGEGDEDADLLLLGDAPSRHDDLQGVPFAGGAGNVLKNAMKDVGIDPESTYITTVVKCLPPASRDPEDEEIEACAPYLLEQIAHVRPQVIVTLGPTATKLMLGKNAPYNRLLGLRLDLFDGVTLIPTFHPIEALRGHSQAVPSLLRDLRTAKGVLDGELATGADAMADLRARHGDSD
ncbi:MAG: uracil-DNA glycosylase [Nitriliruptorales bacterium]|nr:uracil-DNA glycosylase [Nitriliruptorales bacterium]